MLVFCNNIDIKAGSGSSKPTGDNHDEEQQCVDGDSNEFNGENVANSGASLTSKERDLLCKILSNEKVLHAAAKIVTNSSHNSSKNAYKGSNINPGLNSTSSAPMPSFTVNVNANPNLTNSNTNSNTNEVHVTQVQQLYNLLKEYSKATGSFLYRHKYKIIIIAIIIVASILFYKLVILKYALTSSGCLTNCWQSGKALAEIFGTSTAELTKDLLQTICTKFAGPEAFANCSVPLTKFMQEIAAEKAALLAYTKICGALAFLRISFLFPVDKEIIKNSQERLNKISYMQKILNEFMAKSCGERMASGNFA